ncbi:MAG: type IX secretion system membrane protein PorP/SprF [Bacteroidales bacterium]
MQVVDIRNLRIKIYAIVLCIFCLGRVCAQDPHFSQFYSNPLYLNPAFAGATECPRISLAYRNQWPNIPGAFSTINATYDQHINALGGGIGGIVTCDRQGGGAYVSTVVGLVYSYKINITKKFFLRAGVQASFVNRYVNWTDLRFPDQYDPVLGFVRPQTEERIPETPTSKSYADFSAGLLGYNEYFYVGVSVSHLSRPDEGFTGIQRLPMRIVAQAGGKIYFRHTFNERRNMEDFYISPNIIYSQQGPNEEFNYGCYANLRPIVIGLWYRHSFKNSDALIGLIGFQYNGIRIGYSYDLTLSKLSHGGGGHEISFGMQLGCKQKNRKYKKIEAIPCPSF